jgi:hypothetical protein
MTEEATQPESINLSDLQSLLNVIDIATQRGAFKGNELSQVGAVYDKLDVFLRFVADQQQAQQEAQEAQEAQSKEEEEA